jgi:pantoate--beta-alanine ligase
MGALHEGHLSLVRASKKENEATICTIYVNPTQFGDAGDLAKYPRTLEQDLDMLKAENCDAVFCPETGEMYGDTLPLAITFPGLDSILEGQYRPGHFSGVAQVVSKLFHLVEPHRAYFGQKDYQQVMVVQRLTESLKFNLSIVMHPIVREKNGLAMSSRNQRLSNYERERASVLYRSLEQARKGILAGQDWQLILKDASSLCVSASVRLEYLAIADRNTFTLLDKVTEPRHAVILIAGHVGPVRLIDNLLVQP